VSKFQKSLIVYFIVLLGVTIWLYSNDTAAMMFFYIVISVIYSLVLFAMSMMIRQNFYLTAVHQNPVQKVVLTFDDGPHPTETLKILDVLDRHQIKAVFFMIGKYVTQYPEIAKEVANRGHQIGIHSQNHQWNFGFLSVKKLEVELIQCQNEIENVTAVKPILFRPPFGVTNPRVAKAVKNLGLRTIGWNIRTFDTATKSSSTIISKVVNQVKPNSIVLLHDRVEVTTEILPTLIEKVIGMGFAFGPIELKK